MTAFQSIGFASKFARNARYMKNIKCKCTRETNNTVFQLNPTSPLVSLQDVKKAIDASQDMTSYQRLKYFHRLGIHYSRAIRYYKMVKQFEDCYTKNSEDNYILDTPYKPLPLGVDPYEIASLIAEVAREREEEKTKMLGVADNVAIVGRHIISIIAIIACVLIATYVFEESVS